MQPEHGQSNPAAGAQRCQWVQQKPESSSLTVPALRAACPLSRCHHSGSGCSTVAAAPGNCAGDCCCDSAAAADEFHARLPRARTLNASRGRRQCRRHCRAQCLPSVQAVPLRPPGASTASRAAGGSCGQCSAQVNRLPVCSLDGVAQSLTGCVSVNNLKRHLQMVQ